MLLDAALSIIPTCAHFSSTGDSISGFYLISPAGEESLPIEAYCNFTAEETGRFL